MRRRRSSICCILVCIEVHYLSFRADHLGFAYGLQEATFELPATGLVAVVGPNGAGKSTLVSILAGLRRSYSGSRAYFGKEIRAGRRHEIARREAFLPPWVRV